ncbi:MAG: glutaredoxin domain-containing protein, partial [Candidatus Peribacteraceae bacterium]
MNKRLTLAFVFAFIPVFALAVIFPQRAFNGVTKENDGIYVSQEGAPFVVFVSDTCPHCADFKEFALQQQWDVEYLDITQPESQTLFQKLQERTPTLQQGVPTIILNGAVIQGYKDHKSTGQLLAFLLRECQESQEGCLPFEKLLASDTVVKVQTAEGICTDGCEADLDKYIFDLPLLGSVDLTLLSLPTLSILLGFLDGFNPCAMWVLITLLTLLIATRDPKKVWMIGGTFLFVSGLVYYFFIAAWLNAFLLIGYNLWIQKIIGIVAIGGGGFYFYEAFGKDPNTCQVTNLQQRKKIIDRMKEILKRSAWPAMILGVAILAFSVNLIELVCTAGLPAIFTQILAFNNVSHLA